MIVAAFLVGIFFGILLMALITITSYDRRDGE